MIGRSNVGSFVKHLAMVSALRQTAKVDLDKMSKTPGRVSIMISHIVHKISMVVIKYQEEIDHIERWS